jgi:hypothetical protein
MIGGFAMHDLAMFSQSHPARGACCAMPARLSPEPYPKPDLTHLPPDKVFECGELSCGCQRSRETCRRLNCGAGADASRGTSQ